MSEGKPRFHARELRVGGVSKDALLERLAEHGVSLNEYARILFADEAFTTSPEARRVRVLFVDLPDLGLPEGGTFPEILAAAAAFGLEPCPLELAPHLRLDYLDQPEGPYLTVASIKHHEDPEAPNGFYLRRREDGLWLRGYRADDDFVYPLDFRDFVFLEAGR